MKPGALLLALAVLAGPAFGASSVPPQPVFPFADTPEGALFRGDIVFQHYCALCHGAKADGKGRAAKMYQPKPADLLRTDKNADYIELIVRRGGAGVARSPFMPPWGQELTDEQISDVVAFIGSLKTPAAPAK